MYFLYRLVGHKGDESTETPVNLSACQQWGQRGVLFHGGFLLILLITKSNAVTYTGTVDFLPDA